MVVCYVVICHIVWCYCCACDVICVVLCVYVYCMLRVVQCMHGIVLQFMCSVRSCMLSYVVLCCVRCCVCYGRCVYVIVYVPYTHTRMVTMVHVWCIIQHQVCIHIYACVCNVGACVMVFV